jgi:cytochrome c oxidase subunit 2
MRRDLSVAVMLWLAISLVSIGVAVFLMDPFPAVAAEEAEFIDEAFMAMTYMGAPVFAIVLAVLIYGIYRWRTSEPPEDGQDGPPILGTGWFPKAWLGATSALAVVVMIYPGLTGLAELREDDTEDMVIEVTGFFGWQWQVHYPDSGIRLNGGAGGTGDVFMLPDETRIRFDVNASDVLHSFWIPALRQKIDAVPGQTTVMYSTITGHDDKDGDGDFDYDDDVAYRIQCAELCGINHTTMSMKVRIVSPEAFEEWVESQTATAARKVQ